MDLHLQQQVDLRPYNTLALPARAGRFIAVSSVEMLQQALALANRQHWPVTLLGGGSNLVLAADLPGLVIHMAIPGIELVSQQAGKVRVRIGAGENWHQLVQACLARGWFGLENLSLIPGTVGAAPVQNIGAYGVELADSLLAVEMVDLATGELTTLDRDGCRFGYRDSIFKGELRDRVAITAVTLELSTNPLLQLDYPSLRQALQQYREGEITPLLVSETVCRIRRSKLPDPKEIANAGSFFKNPLVTAEAAHRLQQQYPEIVSYPFDSGQLKLAAGWLIEKAGWKGRTIGDIGVHSKQALVLVNYGAGTGDKLLSVAAEIVQSIEQKFGVTLEMEPRVLPEK